MDLVNMFPLKPGTNKADCIKDLDAAFPEFEKLLQAVKSQNKVQILLWGEKLLGTLRDSEKACLNKATTKLYAPADCSADANMTALALVAAITDLEAGDLSKLLSDAENLYAGVTKIEADCSNIEQTYDLLVQDLIEALNLPAGTNKAKCEKDFYQMYPEFSALLKAVKSGNDVQALLDGLELVHTAQDALKQCLNKATSYIESMRKFTPVKAPGDCDANVNATATALVAAIGDLKDDNWAALLHDGEALFMAVSQVEADCTNME